MRLPVFFVSLILAALLVPNAAWAQRLYVANSGDDNVSMFDASVDPPTLITAIALPSGADPHALAISPDARTLAVANFSGSVSLIDVRTNPPSIITTIYPNGGNDFAVAFAPNGKTLYTTYGNQFGQIDLSNSPPTLTSSIVVSPTYNVAGIAVSPDGTRAYAVTSTSSTFGNAVATVNLTTDPPTVDPTLIAIGGESIGIATSPDGKRVYVADQDTATVSIIDVTQSPAAVTTVAVGADPKGLAVSTDGTRVYVTDPGVSAIDVSASPPTVVPISISGAQDPEGIAISTDGGTVYAADYLTDTLSVISTTTNTVTGSVATGAGPYSVVYASLPATTTNVTASANPAAIGVPVTFAVAVTNGSATPPTGTVTVSFVGGGGVATCTITLDASGAGSCAHTFTTAAVYSVGAKYNADSNNAESGMSLLETVAVGGTAVCSVTLTGMPNPVMIDQNLSFTINIASQTGGGPVPTGDVALAFEPYAFTTLTLSAGTAIYPSGSGGTFTYGPGVAGTIVPVQALYAGDSHYAPCTATLPLYVTGTEESGTLLTSVAPNPAMTGEPVNVAASVAAIPSGPMAPTGSVLIGVVGDNSISCTAVLDGSDNGSCALTFPHAGTYSLVAIYLGDANFASSASTPSSETVTAAPVAATPTPTLSLWAVLCLIGLLGVATWQRYRQDRH